MADKEKKPGKSLLERAAPILLLALVAMSFAIGTLYQKVQDLQKDIVQGVALSDSSSKSPAPAANDSDSAAQPQAAVPAVTTEDHVRGSLDADVFLIEYSDYYCPFCSRFHPTAQQARDTYGDQLAWVYRHFPLDQLHPNARALAEISECVASLGGEDAFWAFTDAAYESVPADPAAAIELAASQGVDQAALQSCYDEGTFKQQVQDQYQAGLTAGVTGTPGNFVVDKAGNAQKLAGAVPFENLKSAIDSALGK